MKRRVEISRHRAVHVAASSSPAALMHAAAASQARRDCSHCCFECSFFSRVDREVLEWRVVFMGNNHLFGTDGAGAGGAGWERVWSSNDQDCRARNPPRTPCRKNWLSGSWRAIAWSMAALLPAG